MCGSMVDIQYETTENRRGKKKKKEEKKKKKEEEKQKPPDENIMACPIPQGGHKKYRKIQAEYVKKTEGSNSDEVAITPW